ncbi:histidine phosphatase family protein [Alienimonas sp. DA493]|uniref:histidine phosphatase family protein n=1 Tax=Alienimonas sp. DA493 TaxID=3373605 RepID=UPI003754278A
MTEVAVIRPGCTDYDAQSRIAGRLDLPLNAAGEAQNAELVDALRGLHLSYLLRGAGGNVAATAEQLGERLDLPVKVTEDLCNLDQGLWEGLTVDDVRRRYPKLARKWHDEPESVCPPDGESVGEALERVRRALAKPLKKGRAFGIVAADPLATLIESVVLGEVVEFDGPLGQPRRCGSVTVVSTEGTVREEASVSSLSSEELAAVSGTQDADLAENGASTESR